MNDDAEERAKRTLERSKVISTGVITRAAKAKMEGRQALRPLLDFLDAVNRSFDPRDAKSIVIKEELDRHGFYFIIATMACNERQAELGVTRQEVFGSDPFALELHLDGLTITGPLSGKRQISEGEMPALLDALEGAMAHFLRDFD